MQCQWSWTIVLATFLCCARLPFPCVDQAQAQAQGFVQPKTAPPSEAGNDAEKSGVKHSDMKDVAPIKLELPPLEAGDLRFPINLGTALRLADARPLLIAAAQASAWRAEADLQKANVLWVPDLNFGFVYLRHDGFGPDTNLGVNIPQGTNALGQPDPASFGRPLSQSINFFYGGGALFLMQYFTDILFEPLAARQNLNAARWDVQAAKNDALLMTARAYFNVHKHRGQYAGALYTVERGRKLVEEVEILSKDLLPAVEVERVRTLVADLEQHAVAARRNWRRASADLTQVLRLDPRAVVEPLEHDHLQISLIDPDRPLDDLIPIGLTNRPELASRQELVQAALVRIRQEKLRPIIPVLQVNGFQTPYEQIQFGAMGIGSGGKMDQWSARVDVSPQLMWQLESLGFGYRARVKEQRGEQSRAVAELFQVQDDVASEITTAQARLQSAAARVIQAKRQVRAALVNYNGVYDGLKQTKRFGNVLVQVFRPQEVVAALQLLRSALDHYFAAVAQHNTAQFQLFHALGYPARELSYFKDAGEALTVDTSRPGYLPPVGEGPPPPTR